MATLQESIQQNHNPNDSRLDDLTHQETVIRIHDDFPNISNVLDFIFWQDHIKECEALNVRAFPLCENINHERKSP